MLEHLLEQEFDTYFPLLEQEIKGGNGNLKDTLRLCWKLGQAEEPSRAAQWDNLVR
jgi:hypothetical protein